MLHPHPPPTPRDTQRQTSKLYTAINSLSANHACLKTLYTVLQVVQLLLVCSPQVLAVTSQSRDTDQPTCLHLAARNGHAHVIRSHDFLANDVISNCVLCVKTWTSANCLSL